MAGEKPSHLWEHLIPWERRELAQGQDYQGREGLRGSLQGHSPRLPARPHASSNSEGTSAEAFPHLSRLLSLGPASLLNACPGEWASGDLPAGSGTRTACHVLWGWGAGALPITLCSTGWRDMLLRREAPDRTTSEFPDCRRRAICGKPFSFSPISWLMPLDIYERRPQEELACSFPTTRQAESNRQSQAQGPGPFLLHTGS